MTTTLQENTPRRWLRVLICGLALVLLGLIAWQSVPNHRNDDTTAPTTKTEPTQGRAYWWFDDHGQATRFVDHDGNLLFDKGWSEKDHRFREYEIHSGNLISAYLADGVPATLTTPTKTVKGAASVEVTISTNQFTSLATAYNAVKKERLITHYPPDVVSSPAEHMLRAVLRARLQNGKTVATFVAVNPRAVKNKVVADAYAKGYSPWEMVQGTPEFDHKANYVWDFACTRYAVELKGEKATLAKMRQVLPFKMEDLSIGRGQSPDDLWEGGEYRATTKTPCGVKVVNQRPTSKPSPTPPPPDRPAPKPDPESLPPKDTDPEERPSDEDPKPTPPTSKDPE